MSEEATLPPIPHRRSADPRLDELEQQLEENTLLTAANSKQVADLQSAVAAVDAKIDPLLEMKEAFDNHLKVLCTYGRWTRRILLYGLPLIGALGTAHVGAQQLGWTWWPL